MSEAKIAAIWRKMTRWIRRDTDAVSLIIKAFKGIPKKGSPRTPLGSTCIASKKRGTKGFLQARSKYGEAKNGCNDIG